MATPMATSLYESAFFGTRDSSPNTSWNSSGSTSPVTVSPSAQESFTYATVPFQPAQAPQNFQEIQTAQPDRVVKRAVNRNSCTACKMLKTKCVRENPNASCQRCISKKAVCEIDMINDGRSIEGITHRANALKGVMWLLTFGREDVGHRVLHHICNNQPLETAIEADKRLIPVSEFQIRNNSKQTVRELDVLLTLIKNQYNQYSAEFPGLVQQLRLMRDYRSFGTYVFNIDEKARKEKEVMDCEAAQANGHKWKREKKRKSTNPTTAIIDNSRKNAEPTHIIGELLTVEMVAPPQQIFQEHSFPPPVRQSINVDDQVQFSTAVPFPRYFDSGFIPGQMIGETRLSVPNSIDPIHNFGQERGGYAPWEAHLTASYEEAFDTFIDFPAEIDPR